MPISDKFTLIGWLYAFRFNHLCKQRTFFVHLFKLPRSRFCFVLTDLINIFLFLLFLSNFLNNETQLKKKKESLFQKYPIQQQLNIKTENKRDRDEGRLSEYKRYKTFTIHRPVVCY